MRMMSDSLLGEAAFMGAPGVEEVRWLAPIRPGERIMARGTVLETRPSRSRPDMGFVKFRFELIGVSQQPVMTLVVSPMFARRAAGAAREAEQAGGRS
jgi:acyl dehydratase